MKNAGVQLHSTKETTSLSDKLAGKSFVVSGTFSNFTRDGIKESIEANGGMVKGSVSKKINYLLAGEEAGPSKLEKATKEGVQVLSENDYIAMIS